MFYFVEFWKAMARRFYLLPRDGKYITFRWCQKIQIPDVGFSKPSLN